uniref:Nuclear protein MDM1 n=1 Tax=Electrophorus electricus TaxID=8005 RepID=A0A4W4DME3_ELEEL
NPIRGVSEYQNQYKARHLRSRSAPPHRRMRLAGLRSDQLGINREPQFQSKRRVQVYPPQVSGSLQWKGSSVSPRQQDKIKPGIPPVVPVVQTDSEEKVETPLAPRASKPPRASRATQHQEEVSSAQREDPSADQLKQGTSSKHVNHVLRRKAGLKSECRRNGGRDSEYHRQFHWKTPVADSPLLTAQQMLYTSNSRIPPFKSDPAVMESEYMRSFKGSPPPKPPYLRRDVEINAFPLPQMENPSPDKVKRQKQKEQHFSRRLSPKEEAPPPEPQPLQQKVRSPRAQNDISPKVTRCAKAKTEYSSNFRSPLQYHYRDGAWVKLRTLGEEVRELREKAEAYRKRAWGTHFSRQHLSQILSAQNYLWEASSSTSFSPPSEEDIHSTNSPIVEALDLARVDSVKGSSSRGTSITLTTSRRNSFEGAGALNGPTLPVQRKLAWEEEAGPCESGVAQIEQLRKEPPFQQPVETEERGATESDPSSPEVVSAHLREEGRVPTPKLKTMLNTQRTHHDRTTPTTELLGCSIPQAESGGLPRSALAAGMATVDPLPLNEDLWAADSPTGSPEQTPVRTPLKQVATELLLAASSPHANRIQGMLRNPEFQHNGTIHVVSNSGFLTAVSEYADDRMSEISCRSAASCFMASQVLNHAQRRKEDFWGKS